MENIYMYSFLNKDQDEICVFFINQEDFQIENFCFDNLKADKRVLVAYKSNNYYRDNELFISLKDIYFIEKQREFLQNFICNNGKITIKKNEDLDIQEETRNIKYNNTMVNGCADGFGQSNETAMLILLTNMLQEDYVYLKDIDNKILFKLPNIRKTGHFYVQLKIDNNEYYYNSNYNADYVKNNPNNQCLLTSVQGESSCFFYSMFFIKKCIELEKDEQLTFGKLKEPETNLLIIQNTVNFLCCNENKYIFIKTLDEINDLENKDNYFFFKKDSNFIVCMNRENNILQHFTSNGIELKHMYDQKNISKYCIDHSFEMCESENRSLKKVEYPNKSIREKYQNLSQSSSIHTVSDSHDSAKSGSIKESSAHIICSSQEISEICMSKSILKADEDFSRETNEILSDSISEVFGRLL